jgi:hypothetical protein
LQASLPGNVGLIAQWLDGGTYWIQGATSSGVLTPSAQLVDDELRSHFVMLSGLVAGRHRLSLRRDEFSVQRAGPMAFRPDDGSAWTAAYRYERAVQWDAGLEWLQIESRRDLWSMFYATPHGATERELRVRFAYRVGALPGRAR